MKIKKQAVSLVESVIVTLIISLGLVGVYLLYNNSMRFLDGVESKIQAIQIAREGVEGLENIRNTNWLLFSSNTKKCWNTLNYDGNCIGGTSSGIKNGNYKLYRDKFNRWTLEKGSDTDIKYSSGNYKVFYKVGIDDKLFYNQTGSLRPIGGQKKDRQNFTRRIEIKDTVELESVNGKETNSGSGMLVKVIVEWRDMMTSSKKPRKIKIENIMTNYKK